MLVLVHLLRVGVHQRHRDAGPQEQVADGTADAECDPRRDAARRSGKSTEYAGGRGKPGYSFDAR